MYSWWVQAINQTIPALHHLDGVLQLVTQYIINGDGTYIYEIHDISIVVEFGHVEVRDLP